MWHSLTSIVLPTQVQEESQESEEGKIDGECSEVSILEINK